MNQKQCSSCFINQYAIRVFSVYNLLHKTGTVHSISQKIYKIFEGQLLSGVKILQPITLNTCRTEAKQNLIGEMPKINMCFLLGVQIWLTNGHCASLPCTILDLVFCLHAKFHVSGFSCLFLVSPI